MKLKDLFSYYSNLTQPLVRVKALTSTDGVLVSFYPAEAGFGYSTPKEVIIMKRAIALVAALAIVAAVVIFINRDRLAVTA